MYKSEYDDFIKEYDKDITLKKTNGIYHDRYIIIDYNSSNEKIYHCGTSSKDAGNKITTIAMISETKVYEHLIENLLKIISLF